MKTMGNYSTVQTNLVSYTTMIKGNDHSSVQLIKLYWTQMMYTMYLNCFLCPWGRLVLYFIVATNMQIIYFLSFLVFMTVNTYLGLFLESFTQIPSLCT